VAPEADRARRRRDQRMAVTRSLPTCPFMTARRADPYLIYKKLRVDSRVALTLYA